MKTDGTSIRKLTSDADYSPRWSHSGTKIAFMRGAWDVFVMDADGTDQINVSNSPSTVDWMPDWSPDDSKLAFTRWATPYEEYIYLINADGTDAHAITGSEYNSHAVWSPDGSQIAFHSNRAGMLKNVFVMNADGSSPARLTGRDDWPTDWLAAKR